jgi:hypothetical protein
MRKVTGEIGMKPVQRLGRALTLVLGLLAGQAQAQDVIRYTDRRTSREQAAQGTIEAESPSQVVYKPAASAGTKEVPAIDITDVIYEVPGGVKLLYRTAQAEERKASDPTTRDADRGKALSDAIKSFQEVLDQLGADSQKFAGRHLHFKIARLRAKLADDDPEQRDAAIEALMKFKEQHADGWQITACARLLARQQLAKGDTGAAQRTYEELAALPDIPSSVRKEFELRVLETLIRGQKYAEAQKRMDSLLKSLPADDPQSARVRVYQAQCLGASGKLAEAVTQLRAIIDKTADKDLKALAYNALGDCFRLQGKPRNALWEYLWVDVIYHQDKQEHIKALEQLAQLFEELGDKARARQYRDRLKRETR